MKKLHEKQVKLLNLLRDHIDDPLTIRELQEGLDVSSTGLVHHHIQQLEKKGYLKRNPSNPRDYQILSDPEKEIVYLNVYGLAECGPSGSILDGNPADRIPIASKILNFPSESLFIVVAKGNSMVPKINPKEYVIAQKDVSAQNGDIVVCVNNGEAMIKKYYEKDEKGKKEIILHSVNISKFSPFIADETFKVEGIVRYIISYNFNESPE